MSDTETWIRTDFGRARGRSTRIAYHATTEDSVSALRQHGPGHTFSETWTRDNAQAEWKLTSVEHLGCTDRAA